jgi:DNA mismatch endonuclease (patch repair protein)
MDPLSKKQRSVLMGKIRGRGNAATELKLMRLFRKSKIAGWRRNHRLEGKPDFVFPKDRLVVFVDGCFWHGCLVHARLPMSNRDYWQEKLLRNKKRDQLVGRMLRKRGWKVLRIWEHELVVKNAVRLVKRILRARNPQKTTTR